jgi:hypothetical protein
VHKQYRLLYRAAVAVHGEVGFVDPVLLCDALEKHHDLDAAAGRDAIQELADAAGDTQTFAAHVTIVHDFAKRRHVSGLGDRLKRLARNHALDLTALADACQTALVEAETHVRPRSVEDTADDASDVDLAALLRDVRGVVRRYAVLSEAQACAIALWIAHTHAFDAADATPYLAVTSAEKRSGKTRVLDICEKLVAKPWRLVTPTEAVVFRKIHSEQPTLLLDEADTIFGVRAREQEGLRALLNAGHKHGTTVPRCVGESSKSLDTIDFRVFCPKALAGIGALPDTVADRSIPIRLKRAMKSERPERFREREARELCEPLRADLARWAAAHVSELVHARPAIPEAIHDRAAEGVEPLMAIAEAAGAEWPALARDAFVELFATQPSETDSTRMRLLRDIQREFAKLTKPGLETDHIKIASADLVDQLRADPEAPWADWGRKGGGLTQKNLADLLRPIEIHSKTIRLDDGSTPKGFTLAQFADAFTRYLAPSAPARPGQPAAHEPTANEAALLAEVEALLAEGVVEQVIDTRTA